MFGFDCFGTPMFWLFLSAKSLPAAQILQGIHCVIIFYTVMKAIDKTDEITYIKMLS